MRKFITSRTPFLIILAIFVGLNVIFWPLVCTNNISTSKASVWVGYGFATLAFVICAGCTFIKKYNKNSQVALLPLFKVTSSYFFINLIFNVILMIVNTSNYIWGLVINVLLLLIYICAFLITYKHFSRVDENTKVRETRMKDWRLIAASVSSISTFVNDKDVKIALDKFYEHIKSSSTASSEHTRSVEEELSEQIVTIKSLAKNDADKETILKAIAVAEALLKERNQKLMIR